MSQCKLPSKSFASKIGHFIDSRRLLSPRRIQLVALSGGADSVALLRVMVSLGYRVEAVHCNFHLRGEESDRDERFCESLCLRLGVPFHRVHFDTITYSRLHHVSIEMAARELRYRHFELLREAMEAEAVCVAHHQDDSVETFLLNLITGTGLHGLTGIKPRHGNIVRPLLCASRDEILGYLQALDQDFVTDSTNLVDDVKRNKLRLDVLPLLHQVNPAVARNIARCMERLSGVERIYDDAVGHLLAQCRLPLRESYEKLSIDLSVVAHSPSPSALLYEALRPYGFGAAQIEEMSRAFQAHNKLWQSRSFEALLGGGRLVVAPRAAFGPVSVRIPVPGVYVFHPGADEEQRLRVGILDSDEAGILRDAAHCFLDAARLKFPLLLRNVRPGDRIVPLGMMHSRLVNDILADHHLDLFQRRRQLVVEQADGTLVWIVGLRICQTCRAYDTTERVVSLSLA